MAYYFASNNEAMFDKSSSLVVGTTLAGTFDAGVVDSSILLPAATTSTQFTAFVGAPLIVGGPSVTTRIFGHFELNALTNSLINAISNPTAFFIRFRNSVGQVVFRIHVTGGSPTFLQCQFWNGTTFTDVGATFTLPLLGLNEYDFDFTPGAFGSFNLRINKATVPIVSVSSFNAAVNNVAIVDVGNPTDANAYISQVILANRDLRGAKVASQRPTGNGFHTDGTGTFSDVNTVVKNDLTGIGMTATGQRKSFTHNPLSTTGMVIDSVFINALTGVTGGTVNNLRGIVRRASVTTPTANFSPAPEAGLEQRSLILSIDPSTSLPWTLANYNNSEIGLEARP